MPRGRTRSSGSGWRSPTRRRRRPGALRPWSGHWRLRRRRLYPSQPGSAIRRPGGPQERGRSPGSGRRLRKRRIRRQRASLRWSRHWRLRRRRLHPSQPGSAIRRPGGPQERRGSPGSGGCLRRWLKRRPGASRRWNRSSRRRRTRPPFSLGNWRQPNAGVQRDGTKSPASGRRLPKTRKRPRPVSRLWSRHWRRRGRRPLPSRPGSAMPRPAALSDNRKSRR